MNHPPLPETTVVEYIGMQDGGGRIPDFPLFTIHLPGHRLDGSTVCLETLKANDLPVPNYPKGAKP